MNVLIKNATIIDKSSAFHKQAADVQVENGIIKKIGKNITVNGDFKIIELSNQPREAGLTVR